MTCGVLLALLNSWFRAAETVVAGPLIRFATGSVVVVHPSSATVFFDLYTRKFAGLTVTGECTAALPVAALVAFAGVVMLSGRFPIATILLGLAVASTLVFAVNQFRVLLIAWSTHHFGMTGYGWSHTTVGSLVTIVGVTGALGAFLVIITRGSHNRPSRTDHDRKAAL